MMGLQYLPSNTELLPAWHLRTFQTADDQAALLGYPLRATVLQSQELLLPRATASCNSRTLICRIDRQDLQSR